MSASGQPLPLPPVVPWPRAALGGVPGRTLGWRLRTPARRGPGPWSYQPPSPPYQLPTTPVCMHPNLQSADVYTDIGNTYPWIEAMRKQLQGLAVTAGGARPGRGRPAPAAPRGAAPESRRTLLETRARARTPAGPAGAAADACSLPLPSLLPPRITPAVSGAGPVATGFDSIQRPAVLPAGDLFTVSKRAAGARPSFRAACVALRCTPARPCLHLLAARRLPATASCLSPWPPAHPPRPLQPLTRRSHRPGPPRRSRRRPAWAGRWLGAQPRAWGWTACSGGGAAWARGSTWRPESWQARWGSRRSGGVRVGLAPPQAAQQGARCGGGTRGEHVRAHSRTRRRSRTRLQ